MQGSTTFSGAGNGLRLGAWLGIAAAPTLALPRFAREGMPSLTARIIVERVIFGIFETANSLPCEAGEGWGGGAASVS
jgi:hypothetical protein